MTDKRLLHVEHWQDDFGRAKDLGVVWTLKKGNHTARCVLQGHPVGIEARVLIDGEIHRTQAFRGRKDSKEMIDATWEWRRCLLRKIERTLIMGSLGECI